MSAALDGVIARAREAARASGAAQQLAVRRTLTPEEAALEPLSWLAAARGAERFYLERKSAGRALVALGSSCAIESAGEERFARASGWLRQLRGRTWLAGVEPERAAELVGGFAFAASQAGAAAGEWSAFPSLRFWLPRILVARDADGARLTLALRVEPGDTLDALRGRVAIAQREAAALARSAAVIGESRGAQRAARVLRPARGYRRLVALALDAIGKGEAEKLVVARTLEVEGVRAPLTGILHALREAHPRCAVFAVAPPAPRDASAPVFVGATPELLARVQGRALEAQALAGSAARGRTPALDTRARRALFASAKEQCEHALVVSALRDALAPLCDEIAIEERPHALCLSGVQHLETRVRARLASESGARLLDVAGRLHPSPAVAGTPREAASRWLTEHERLARGWYSGGVGALDASGDGELFVALRCALLSGEHARLFAGAGIVAGSRPDAETRETRLKLRPLLGALQASRFAARATAEPTAPAAVEAGGGTRAR